MLGKLMKHELRATARIMLPLYVLLLVSAALFALTMFLAENYEILALSVFLGIISTVFAVTMIGAGVCTVALTVYRFYKNLMTDEGYLMFTLPATVDQLLWAKLLCALIWSACTTAAELVAGLIASSNFFLRDELSFFFGAWDELDVFSTGQWISFGVQTVAALILSVFCSYLLFYAAIALGHSFANHKVLLSVVFYFAFTFGLQTIGSFASVFGIVYLDSATPAFFEDANAAAIAQAVLLGALILSALLSAIFYVLTRQLLKRRLNLA